MKALIYKREKIRKISMKLKTFTVHIHMKNTHELIYRRPPPGFQWFYKITHIIFTL